MRKWGHIAIVAALVAAVSCSTTRVLGPGEYRLTKVDVKAENDKKFKTAQVESYIKQKPGSISPMLFVYNWSGKEVNNAFDRLLRKIGTPPVVYNPDLVNSSIENLERRLEYLGYYCSTVKADVSVKGKKVKVKYLLNLGKRYPIQDIEYILPERGDFAEDFIKDTASVTVRPGDFLSEDALEKETVRSAAHFRKVGYYGFNKNYYFFEADTLSTPGVAHLKMKVNEYTRNETPKSAKPLKRFTFGSVDIIHPKRLKIREQFLRNLNTIKPGHPYSEDAVNNAYSRLSSLRMFNSVNLEMEPSDSNVVDCRINLSPSRLQGFKLKLEASSNSSGLLGVSPELSYYHKNLFHGGELLNLSLMGNFQFKFTDAVRATEFGASAGITFPRFIGLPYSFFSGALPNTEIKASFNSQNRPEYSRTIISTSFGYSGSYKNIYYQFYPLRLSVVKLNDVTEDFAMSLIFNPFILNSYISHFDLGAAANIYYTTNNDLNPKTSYQYIRFQVNSVGNILSLFKGLMPENEWGERELWGTPFSQYVRAELSLGRTFCFGKDDLHSFAMRFMVGAGFAYGNSEAMPFEQHFYAGGANSMRGWQARSVGPGFSEKIDLFVIPNQTGDMKMEADIEYRFPLFWKLRGAVFAEAGNVWDISGSSDSVLYSSKFYESLAADWGVGLRLDLNVILIRVDLGIQAYVPSMPEGQRWRKPKDWFGSDNYAIHFGVGYPF